MGPPEAVAQQARTGFRATVGTLRLMTEQPTAALPRAHRGLVTTGLVALGVVLTVGALVINVHRAEREARLQTERAVDRAATAMGSDFERIDEVVSALAGFVMSSESVERDEFDRFVGRFLDGHPEIRSMQLLDYVRDAERGKFESRLAEVGVSGITEADSRGALTRAPERDQYLVTWFDAPQRRSEGGTGMSVFNTPDGANLVSEMVDRGATGASVSQMVRGLDGEISEVRLLWPVFDSDLSLTTAADRSEALVGAASAVTSLDRVFDELSSPVDGSSDLLLSVDGTDDAFLMGRVGGEPVTPQSASADTEPSQSPTASREVVVGNRSMLLEGSPRAGAAAALAAETRRWILVIGALLTIVAAAVYIWWSRVRRLERFALALRKANEALEERAVELRKVAELDHLTGLPNRQSVHRMVDEAMNRPDAPEVSVVLVDLDRFKEVNDSIGHRRGDELIRMVADRLATSVRSGTLGRLDGDVFAVLLTEVEPSDAAVVADRLVSTLRRPFRMGNRSVSLTGTAAVCSSRSDTWSAVELMDRLDVALHSQKARSRDTWVVYDSSMAAQQERRRSIETELRYALEGNGTVVLTHFQPKVDLMTGRIVSAEGLARWKHPNMGEVSPGEFIGVAEETGLIVRLGEVQIERTIELLKRCRMEGLDLDSISVNVSAQQLSDERLVEHIRARLRDAEVPAASLVLEITESAAMDQADDGAISERLENLATMGIGLSIDDFGTGYSSMSRVERLAANEVKLDQSFVAGLPDRRVSVGIIRSIVVMAHALGMRVVAEGVETTEQHDWLLEEGCDQGQGWLYARAMGADGFLDALRSQQRAGETVGELRGSIDPGQLKV